MYHYPPGYSFFGTYQRALKVVNSPLEVMQDSVNRFGESYSVADGFKGRMILTQNPDFIDYVLRRNQKNYNKSKMVTQKLGRFIGNGLLTSNGAYWLQQRRLIQPGFHPQKVQALFAIMKQTVDDFLATLPRDRDIDIFPMMNRLALNVVIKTLFDIDLKPETIDQVSRFVSEVQEFVITDIRQPYKSWWFELSGQVAKQHAKATRTRELMQAMIEDRRKAGRKFNDLLDMLLDARYEDTGLGMTDEQILDEIMILFIAGHETTGNALTWTLHLLARHPAIMKQLRDETEGLEIGEIVNHPLLMAVINESMRLYPPAWISDRVCLEEDSFGDFNYPRGTLVAIFFFGLHRSERYWEDPLQFKPERFLDRNRDKDKGKVFFPFGSGPRLCIGNNFALAEMALFIQAFIQKFDVQSNGPMPAMRALVTLRPGPSSLRIAERKK